jgi:hypothetical protein
MVLQINAYNVGQLRKWCHVVMIMMSEGVSTPANGECKCAEYP